MLHEHLPTWAAKRSNIVGSNKVGASDSSARALLPVTDLLRAMWHIRPQHNPANHLCQLLPFVPHSSSSIPLVLLLPPPSFSMLSLVFPVFAALFPHDVADEFPSSPSHVLTEFFYLSHLQDFFVCNSFFFFLTIFKQEVCPKSYKDSSRGLTSSIHTFHYRSKTVKKAYKSQRINMLTGRTNVHLLC